MHRRVAGRAMTAAAALALACSGAAAADSVYGDADTITAGNQGFVNLGTVAAGSTRDVDVAFELACLGLAHVDPNVVVTLTPTTAPATGGSMTATPASLGPVPAEWPLDGDPCVDDPVLRGAAVSKVSITAPATEGNHVFKVTYAKSPSGGLTGTTAVQFLVTVVANTAPVLHLPADMTVEGNTTGGWVADYVVTASDAEDDPDPTASCDVVPGGILPLGTSTVTCAATDQAGTTTTGSFAVTVVDTTPPVVAAAPDLAVEAGGPAGVPVEFAPPAASDTVDLAPVVVCDPPSGSVFTPGKTTVTCTATDASGNAARSSFAVEVVVAAPDLTASWQRPLGAGVPALFGNAGRTIPLKLVVLRGDTAVGPADIAAPTLRVDRLADCSMDATVIDGGPVGAFLWSDGTWHRNLDTGPLGAGCVRVTASLGGEDLASAVIQLVRPSTPAKRAR